MVNEKMLKAVKEFQQHDKDTGSIEIQIIRMTEKINQMAKHFEEQPKDFSSRRGLTNLVNRRRNFLNYLKRKNEALYKKLIGNLGLRK